MATIPSGTLQEDIYTWNKRLSRHVKVGQPEKTIELFRQMLRGGMEPDKFTFVPVLNACSSLRDLENGRLIHAQIMQGSFESDIYVSNSLVDMYCKCGSIADAWMVFNKMPTRCLVSWNTMVLGFVKCGKGQIGLELTRQMQREGIAPDRVTFVGMLNACATLMALEDGRAVHQQVIQRAYESDIFVASSLIDMYAKCGSIGDAWRIFTRMPTRDVVAWGAMILGYVTCGEGHMALELFHQMQREGLKPNAVTFIGVLNACASLGLLEEGRRVHEQIIQTGYESDVFVASSLVDMYEKCGSIVDAWRVFKKMSRRDVVAWSVMISGFAKCGEGKMALELFQQMKREGTESNPVTFVGVLNACASALALEEGRRVHGHIIQSGCQFDIHVASSLVDMFCKCGSIEDARSVFDKMRTRDVAAWTAMLAGYASHGHAREAIKHFEGMHQAGVEVDEITFLSLLSACSHGGLVDEGLHFFGSMHSVYKISPTTKHYACVIDLLGRAGRLHEAGDLIKVMSCEPSVDVQRPLLGTCRIHGNMEIGASIAKQVLELDFGNFSTCVL